MHNYVIDIDSHVHVIRSWLYKEHDILKRGEPIYYLF